MKIVPKTHIHPYKLTNKIECRERENSPCFWRPLGSQNRDVTKAFPLDFLLAGQLFPQLEVITALLFSFFSCFFFFSPCLLFKGIEGWFRTGGGNRVKTAAFGHGIYERLLRVCVCTCLRVFRKIFDIGTPSRWSWRRKLQCNHNLLHRLFWCMFVWWSEKKFLSKRDRERMRMG